MKHMTELLIFVSFLTPLTTAVTELIKRSFTKFPKQFHTLLAVIVAIGLASLAWVFTDLSATYRIWGGLFAGLSGAKLYDISKNLAKK
jgi:Bacteriophage A118-like holin, Hol118